MFDDRGETNAPFAALLGANQTARFNGTRGVNSSLNWVKQDLPWAEELDTVVLSDALLASSVHTAAATPLGVFGQRVNFTQLPTPAASTAPEGWPWVAKSFHAYMYPVAVCFGRRITNETY
jgi:hypothetical protein